MNALRTACLAVIFGSLACNPTTTPADSGTDSGTCAQESDTALCKANSYSCGAGMWVDNCGVTRTVASCGTCSTSQTCSQTSWTCVEVATDGGGDAGPSTPDAGQDAGPPPGTRSCTGVANCVEQLSPISVQGAVGCESDGTTTAANVFTPLLLCAEACAGGSDAGGCLNALISTPTADGGCETQWDNCQADGVSCAAVLGCASNPANQANPEPCVLEGTAGAIQLAEGALGCAQAVCADAGTTSAACATAAQGGGVCAQSFGACANDGVHCGDILGCVEAVSLDAGIPDETDTQCVEKGNETALQLFSSFYTCLKGACGTPDGGTPSSACGKAQSTDGGMCTAQFAACLTDGVDAGPACTPESDSALCAAQTPPWFCGSLTATDNCGTSRTVNCGTCATNATCNTTTWTCQCNSGFQGDAGTGNGSTCTPDAG